MQPSARCRAACVFAVLGFALAASGWAVAPSNAAVTLGSNLETEPTHTTYCTNSESTRGCLAEQDTLPGRELIAPFNGVIVRWHVRLGPKTQEQRIRIRVMRPFAPQRFTIIRSGSLELIENGAGTYTFPAALPISAGDQVAIEEDRGKETQWMAGATDARALIFNLGPGLDGTETGAPAAPLENEVTFNVEIEPDCDHDGLGDETQDPDTSSCKPPPPSVSTGLPEAPKTCVVPNLKGRTLKAAKKRARKANCRIGHVKLLAGATNKTSKVVKQKPKAGKVKAAGSKITVTLG